MIKTSVKDSLYELGFFTLQFNRLDKNWEDEKLYPSSGENDLFPKFIEFIKSRVGDGKFNNSSFVEDRYGYLVVYDVTDNNNKLKRVSDKEVMLYRKDAPMIKVNVVIKAGNI